MGLYSLMLLMRASVIVMVWFRVKMSNVRKMKNESGNDEIMYVV